MKKIIFALLLPLVLLQTPVYAQSETSSEPKNQPQPSIANSTPTPQTNQETPRGIS